MKTHTIKTLTAELETLKNLYAQEQGYEDWAELLFKDGGYYARLGIESHMDEICIRAQKLALQNAADNIETKIEESYAGSMGNEFGQLYNKHIVVDKESITNPENIIR